MTPTDEELREAVAKVRTIPYVRNIPVDLENALDAVLASLEEARKDSARIAFIRQYLAEHKFISGPLEGSPGWELGYNGGPAYVIDAWGETLEEAVDSAITAAATSAEGET